MEPLYACGRAVLVTNISPGTLIQIWRDNGQKASISNPVNCYGREVIIPVHPYLVEGEKIWAQQWACGITPIMSNTVVVQQHPPVEAPVVIEPLYYNTSVLAIKNALPGSLLQAYILPANSTDWLFCGDSFGRATRSTINLFRVLSVGDQVKVCQLICSAGDQEKIFSSPVTYPTHPQNPPPEPVHLGETTAHLDRRAPPETFRRPLPLLKPPLLANRMRINKLRVPLMPLLKVLWMPTAKPMPITTEVVQCRITCWIGLT
jgi:hypothetical protein